MVSAEFPLLPDSVRDLERIFCGCVTTENTWAPIIAELERLDRKEFKKDDDLAASIVNHLKLSKHGTSIRSGWLTDTGKEALAFLRVWGHDWCSKAEFVDSEGVHYGAV